MYHHLDSQFSRYSQADVLAAARQRHLAAQFTADPSVTRAHHGAGALRALGNLVRRPRRAVAGAPVAVATA